MRRALLTPFIALLLALLPTAEASAAPAPSCTGLTVTVDTFLRAGPPLSGWVENIGFDGSGGMWLSMFDGSFVKRDANGRASTTFQMSSPGASLLGPDGLMYVEYGDSLNAPEAGIMRFDPRADAPVLAPFAKGAAMANGLGLDKAGNFYIGDTSAGVVQRVRPDGTFDPTFRVAAPGADGVVVVGDNVYVAQLTDLSATILKIPIADPSKAAPLAKLADDGIPRLVDDLDVGPDGALYVASILGFLIRVDPTTGAACTVVGGLAPLTTARFAKGFAPFDARKGDLFLASEAGQVYHVRISGLRIPETPATTPAAMRVSLAPSRVRVGARSRIRVVVRSADTGCRAGVAVKLGSTTVRTNRRGRATLRFTARERGTRTVRATKSGCRRASAQLRVR